MVPFTWRSRYQLEVCSHVQDPFTSRGIITCMLLFTLGSDTKYRDCDITVLDRTLDSHSYCVLSIDQAFCESLYLSYDCLKGLNIENISTENTISVC